MKYLTNAIGIFALALLSMTAVNAQTTATNTTSISPQPIADTETLKNSATAQLHALQTFVAIGDQLQIDRIDVTEPCTFVTAVVSQANVWPASMLEVPQGANLNVSETAKLQQAIADSENLLNRAFAIEASASCLKPNGKCCDQSDPLNNVCVTRNNKDDCNLAPPSLVCSAASTKC